MSVGTPARSGAPERRAVRLARALLGFEAALYATITPLLPHYQHALGASKAAIGLLAAAYSAGLIPGALLGGWLGARAGVRRTTSAGLVAFAAASIAFGLAGQMALLDVTRALQGVGSGVIWGGALTWAVAVAPPERRGATLGSVIAAAVVGTLFGPALGALALAVGTVPLFCALGACSLALAGWTLAHPEPATRNDPEPTPGNDPEPTAGMAHACDQAADRLGGDSWADGGGRAWLGSGGLVLGAWLIGLEAATMGAVYALIPLKLGHLGASGVEIAATFVAASALSAALSPAIGRLCDRFGASVPALAGLLIAAPLVAILPLPGSAALLAVLCVLVAGGALSAYMIPAAALIADATERAGVTLAAGTMVFNLAWALGQTAGAPAAGALAQSTGDSVPFLAIAAVMLASALAAAKGRPAAAARGRQPGERAGAPA